MGVQINGDTGNVIATKGTYSGNVTIGGTLTYEDVTNIDSVGLVTARQGIEVGARPGVAASISVDGNMIVSGITTIGGNVKVGTGITLSPDGDIFFTGIITGNGSGLTNAGPSLTGSTDNTVVTVTGANAIQGESNLVFTGTRLGINQTSPAPLSGGGAGVVHVAASDNPEVVLERTASGTEAKASIRVTDSEEFKVAVKDGSASTVNAVSIASSTGFMTNVNPVFCIKPTNGSQSSPNGVNTKIQFAEHVITERGSGVDFTNNRYVAPIGGYYHFAYTVYTYYTSMTYIDVQKNGSIFHRNWGLGVTNQANPYTTTGSLTMLLVKGDYIELFSQVATTSDGYVFSASSNPTIFMGHLIG